MPDLVHRRLRAPREDGAALIDPPREQIGPLIAQNRRSAQQWDVQSAAPLVEWRREARGTLVKLGSPNRISDEVAAALAEKPIVMSGHQPELFHPGVWFKNFLLDSVAREVGGLGVNLIIDNDLARSAAIRVPANGSNSGEARIVDVAFDAAQPPVPWQERQVIDLDLFASFPQRVREAFGGFAREELLLDSLWPHATRHVERTLRDPVTGDRLETKSTRSWLLLGDTLARARHEVEQQLGLHTREVALSTLCEYEETFRAFAAHFFERAEEFHAIYNAALAEYRAVNHIRSHSHPVPDLAREGEWLEMPFWLWSEHDPERRRAYVRRKGRSWELSDRRLSPIRPNVGFLQSVLQSNILHWEDPEFKIGLKLRPRALITTMYARLVLSDLFLHGIGGAKYDELTDLIIRRFFGIEPPKYVTATATFRLPIERPSVTPDDVRAAQRHIRDARYRPEAFLRDKRVTRDNELYERLSSLAAEKREYLAQHDLRRCEQEVFHRLDCLNRAMHHLLRPVEEELRAEHAQLARDLRRSQALGSREFSFVLFPAEKLPARLLELCELSS